MQQTPTHNHSPETVTREEAWMLCSDWLVTKQAVPDSFARNGDRWTGEVNFDGRNLCFVYQSADGARYETHEEPVPSIYLN
jgi:hypothetical protein